jgi:formylmethanofuran dehydrogenase subunit E
MEALDELLRQAEIAHGHLCAGQVLGVRMAMLGCRRLGIAEPRGSDRKRLVTYIEIDRCATDAIGVVTGCRLGKRALKFRDWGKMAATFVDLGTGRAIRIVALESSKQRARELYPNIADKNQQQMKAYREMDDAELLGEQWVEVAAGSRRRCRATRASGSRATDAAKGSTTTASWNAMGRFCASPALIPSSATTGRPAATRRSDRRAAESRCECA